MCVCIKSIHRDYRAAPWHRLRPPSLLLWRRGRCYGPNRRSPGTTWRLGVSCDAAAAPSALCSLFPSSSWTGQIEEEMLKFATLMTHIPTKSRTLYNYNASTVIRTFHTSLPSFYLWWLEVFPTRNKCFIFLWSVQTCDKIWGHTDSYPLVIGPISLFFRTSFNYQERDKKLGQKHLKFMGLKKKEIMLLCRIQGVSSIYI